MVENAGKPVKCRYKDYGCRAQRTMTIHLRPTTAAHQVGRVNVRVKHEEMMPGDKVGERKEEEERVEGGGGRIGEGGDGRGIGIVREEKYNEEKNKKREREERK